MDTKKKKQLTQNDTFFILGLMLLPVIIVPAVLFYSGILVPSVYAPPCYIYTLTGYTCPGCGSTRAVHALFTGHFLQSLRYNPGIIYFFLIYIPFMASNIIASIRSKSLFEKSDSSHHGMRLHPAYIYLGIALIVVYNFVRLILNFNSL